MIHEAGVLPQSLRFIFTPSSFAERALLYPTRAGHYFCARAYHFSFLCDIAMQKSHRNNLMLMLIKHGALDLNCDGRHYVAERQQVALFDCRRPHEYFALSDALEFYWLLFNGLQAEAMYHEVHAMHGDHYVFAPADPARVQQNFMSILTLAESNRRMPEFQFAETVYSILCHLMTPCSGDGETGALIEKACRYIDRHFRESLAVQDIASYAGLCSSYFSKLFRRETGYSPHEYLTLRRIDHAKTLLLTSDTTIREIAYASGYNSEENFIRAFKNKVGLSPDSFRNFPV